MKFIILQVFICVFSFSVTSQSTQKQSLDSGKISFVSNAPLEVIKAATGEISGVLDLNSNRLAFSVRIRSFDGFNSPLQREHFNENYMESSKYPTATFNAKIIENVDLTEPGEYMVRTKGDLNIHGIAQERIIKGVIRVMEDEIEINAAFSVPLEDHDITIPRIVYQKIAEEIQVSIQAKFKIRE